MWSVIEPDRNSSDAALDIAIRVGSLVAELGEEFHAAVIEAWDELGAEYRSLGWPEAAQPAPEDVVDRFGRELQQVVLTDGYSGPPPSMLMIRLTEALRSGGRRYEAEVAAQFAMAWAEHEGLPSRIRAASMLREDSKGSFGPTHPKVWDSPGQLKSVARCILQALRELGGANKWSDVAYQAGHKPTYIAEVTQPLQDCKLVEKRANRWVITALGIRALDEAGNDSIGQG